MRGVRLMIGFFFIVLPSIFVCIGAAEAWKQHRKISTYVPVDAVVVSSAVKTNRGPKRPTFSPDIEYRFDVRGRSYSARGLLATHMNASEKWAREIVDRYPAGTRTTAYHDPVTPSQAFLVREYKFFPYMFVLFPMIHLSVGIALVFGVRWTRSPRHATPPPRTSRHSAWFELQPRRSLSQRLRVWTIMSALWYGVGAIACGHFFLNASPQYGKLEIIGTLAYAAVGMIPGGVWLYHLLLMRRTSDPIVMISAQHFAPGHSFQVRVVQLLHQDTSIESFKVGLVCDKHVKLQTGNKTRYNTVVECEDWHTLVENHSVRADQPLERLADLTVPKDRPGTSVGSGYPCYEWRIEVRAALRDSPDYQGEFPIHVDGAATVG